MRHIAPIRLALVITVAAVVGVGLAACSAPITSKDVSLRVTATAPADTLIGDNATILATAKLADGHTDKLVLSIQSSTDGRVWRTDKFASKKGPRWTLTETVVQKKAGKTYYRAILSVTKARKPLRTATAESAIVTSDIKSLVRAFFYDRTQAYAESARAGADWDTAHDTTWYPLTSEAWKKGSTYYVKHKETETSVPDLTTIAPDPTWKLPKSACSPAMTTPPGGRTFIVTVAIGGSIDGFPLASEKSDLHVTLDGGKLVDYVEACR